MALIASIVLVRMGLFFNNEEHGLMPAAFLPDFHELDSCPLGCHFHFHFSVLGNFNYGLQLSAKDSFLTPFIPSVRVC